MRPEPTGAGGPGGQDELGAALSELGPLARPGMPLGPLTTYRVGGAAAVGVVAAGLDDLGAVARARAASGLPVLVVGRGSNMLVADAGYPGIAVVLDTDALGWFAVDGTAVTSGAALALPMVARRSVEAGLTGLEWAVGVPGSVGGGVRMNAGGHGSEVARTLVSAEVVDLDQAPPPGAPASASVRRPADLAHGYRRSSLRASEIVVSATFSLVPGDPEQGRATIRDIVRWRREHQPGGQNAGSVFTNPSDPTASTGDDPPGMEPDDPVARSAGWLIEHAGGKGLRVGTAQVSPKHANFIQADPGGSADDVRLVMKAAAEKVAARWGIELSSEIRLIGFEAEGSPSTRGSR